MKLLIKTVVETITLVSKRTNYELENCFKKKSDFSAL